MNKLMSFWTDESGQSSTGYAVVFALVAIVLVLVLVAFRDEIARALDEIKEDFRTKPRLR